MHLKWRRSESALTSTRWWWKSPFLLLRWRACAPSWGYSDRIAQGVRGHPRYPASHGCFRSADALSVQVEEAPRTSRRSRDSPVSLRDSNPRSGTRLRLRRTGVLWGQWGGAVVRLREGSDVVAPEHKVHPLRRSRRSGSDSRCKQDSRTQLCPGGDLSPISATWYRGLLARMVGTVFLS